MVARSHPENPLLCKLILGLVAAQQNKTGDWSTMSRIGAYLDALGGRVENASGRGVVEKIAEARLEDPSLRSRSLQILNAPTGRPEKQIQP